ncbi:hypothetical protein CDIK_1545 [Cucumispora dikerogammari]|nr:hypothetical protein CDIK_1545 [Cucumispora dikerogammari]
MKEQTQATNFSETRFDGTNPQLLEAIDDLITTTLKEQLEKLNKEKLEFALDEILHYYELTCSYSNNIYIIHKKKNKNRNKHCSDSNPNSTCFPSSQSHLTSPENKLSSVETYPELTLNITNLYKLLYLSTLHLDSHTYSSIYKIIDLSLPIHLFKDPFIDLDSPGELDKNIVVLINFLIQTLDTNSCNIKFLNEFFNYLGLNDVKCIGGGGFVSDSKASSHTSVTQGSASRNNDHLAQLKSTQKSHSVDKPSTTVEDTTALIAELSNKNFWGKTPFILNVLLSLCNNDIYDFKLNDILAFSKNIVAIINTVIKVYKIISTAIEIELIYENEYMGLRQLSVGVLEKGIEFYLLQYKTPDNNENISNNENITNNENINDDENSRKRSKTSGKHANSQIFQHNKNILISIAYNLHLISKRLNDTSHFVRLKSINSLCYLLENSMIPLFFVNSVNLLVLNKVLDRTLMVRRKAVEYLRVAVAKHWFGGDANVVRGVIGYRKKYFVDKIGLKDNIDTRRSSSFDRIASVAKSEEKYIINPETLEGFFFTVQKHNLSITEMLTSIENLTDNSAITNFLQKLPDKEFKKNSLLLFSHLLYTIISLFDKYILYILNTNTVSNKIVTVNIQDIESWLEIIVMIGYYNVDSVMVSKCLNEIYLLSKECGKEGLIVCLKGVGRLISMGYSENNSNSNVVKNKDKLIRFLDQIHPELLVELAKYQQMSIDSGWIVDQIKSCVEGLSSNGGMIDVDMFDERRDDLQRTHVNTNTQSFSLDAVTEEPQLCTKSTIKFNSDQPTDDKLTEEYFADKLHTLLSLSKALNITISVSHLAPILKYLYLSTDLATLTRRQSLFRNYVTNLSVTQTLIEKLYVINCKMNYNDLILDSILIEKIYSNNELLSKIDTILSNILQIIANSGNTLKLYSVLGVIVFQHSKYLDNICTEMKNNLNNLSLLSSNSFEKEHPNIDNENIINSENNMKKRIYEIFFAMNLKKRYRERRKSLAEERSSIRGSFQEYEEVCDEGPTNKTDNLSLCADNNKRDKSNLRSNTRASISDEKLFDIVADSACYQVTHETAFSPSPTNPDPVGRSGVKSADGITENDIDDAIFYLKDHELLYTGLLSSIYTQLVTYLRSNILNPISTIKDLNLFTTAFKVLCKCMCLSAESFSQNFDIYTLILTTKYDIPIDLRYNSVVALYDFFLNYNSFVESLSYVFFESLYIKEIHMDVLILIVNLSKHGVLKVSGYWLKVFLSLRFLYYEFYDVRIIDEQPSKISRGREDPISLVSVSAEKRAPQLQPCEDSDIGGDLSTCIADTDYNESKSVKTPRKSFARSDNKLSASGNNSIVADSLITYYINNLSENNISLLIYECICGVLFSDLSLFTDRIVSSCATLSVKTDSHDSNIDDDGLDKKKTNANIDFKVYFTKYILKITAGNITEKTKVSLFLRFLRAGADDLGEPSPPNTSDTADTLAGGNETNIENKDIENENNMSSRKLRNKIKQIIFKEFAFTEKGINEMMSDENFINWRSVL